MENVTIHDVAKAAGVSLATVSRVVRGQDNVRPKTKDKVMAVIKELGYQPNALARQLRTQETGVVIAIVPDISNSFFHEMLRGIEEEAEKCGYQVLIADMHNEPSIEKHYYHAIQQRQADGVISLSANVAGKLLQEVAEEYPIVVACQYMENKAIPNVTIDNKEASMIMTEHLLNLGHRKIAFLSGPEDFPLYRDRCNGYLEALSRRGITPDPGLIQYTTPSIQGGFEGTEALLAVDPSFTAVYAAGDTMAIGAMKALKKYGKQIPSDCAVVGFDDIELSSVWEPALTTIRQPKYRMGAQAFQKLYKLMKKEPILYAQEILPYELVIRESCGYYSRG